MKRIIGIMSLCSLWVVATTGVALAQEGSSLSVEPTASTKGTGGGTAFTGSNTSGLMLAIAALVAVGLVALFVARRRAAHSA